MRSNILCGWVLALLVSLAVGCGEEGYTGPEAISPSEVTPLMQSAFQDASDEAKEMADKAVALFEEEKLIEANAQFQALCARRDLSEAQLQTASRCLITMGDEMRRAVEEKKDKKMEQYMRVRRAVK